MKKDQRPLLGYLREEELAHLLAQVNRALPDGERDYLLLALLYDTGARIQELLDLTPDDFRLASPAVNVRLKVARDFRAIGSQIATWAEPRDCPSLEPSFL